MSREHVKLAIVTGWSPKSERAGSKETVITKQESRFLLIGI